MSLKKLLLVAVCAVLVLGGCGTEENLSANGDPAEVTCERLEGVIQDFRDVDLESMNFGDIFARVSEGFTELETIADEAQDDQLGKSIDRMSETLNDSIASSGGNVDAIGAEFTERLQQPEAQEAAKYLRDTCSTELSFDSITR